MLTIKTATSPVYADADHTSVNLTVTFLVGEPPAEEIPDTRAQMTVPFTAMESDTEANGRDLFLRALNEEFGVVTDYTVPAPVVPKMVSRFQARAALYQAGHLETVEAFMAQASTPMMYKLAWQDARDFERASSTVEALRQVLQLTPQDIDNLFLAAALITA